MAPSWFSSLFGRSDYTVLPTTNEPIPGAFPDLESRPESPESPRESPANRILQWLVYLISRPIVFIIVVSLTIIARLCSLLFFDGNPSHRHRSASESATTNSNALINDPISKVENFVRSLEESLPPVLQQVVANGGGETPQLPPFFLGSYTQALCMTINRGKFLYVYLTNPKNESSTTIFDRIITNPRFISIFTTENSANHNILWGGDLTNLEAYQLANSLNVSKFPFLGLLCLTRTTTMTPQGPSKTAPKISLILKIQGGISNVQDPVHIIQNKFVKRALKYELELVLIRNELREKYMNEMMRRQQNLNYQRSLLKDKQKKAEKAHKELAAKYLKWRQPDIVAMKEDQHNHAHKARIGIKLLSGNRVTFYFPEDAPIEDIYLFVELHNHALIDKEVSSELSAADGRRLFKDFQYPYKFRLISSVPPLPLLDNLSRDTIIKDVSYIYPSGLLMVERL